MDLRRVNRDCGGSIAGEVTLLWRPNEETSWLIYTGTQKARHSKTSPLKQIAL